VVLVKPKKPLSRGGNVGTEGNAKYPLGLWAEEDNTPVRITNYHAHS
jgi:hypothetical protein